VQARLSVVGLRWNGGVGNHQKEGRAGAHVCLRRITCIWAGDKDCGAQVTGLSATPRGSEKPSLGLLSVRGTRA
jgi:hypothetical protein